VSHQVKSKLEGSEFEKAKAQSLSVSANELRLQTMCVCTWGSVVYGTLGN
jgi:hypothetical protein